MKAAADKVIQGIPALADKKQGGAAAVLTKEANGSRSQKSLLVGLKVVEELVKEEGKRLTTEEEVVDDAHIS